MKLEENKHDHKLTNWLKVGIFALLMLAPMFASISQTLYVTFNKNAYQSYSNQMLAKVERVSNVNQLINGQQYDFYLNEDFTPTSTIDTYRVHYSSISVDFNEILNNGVDTQYNNFNFRITANWLNPDIGFDLFLYYDDTRISSNRIYYGTEKYDQLKHIVFVLDSYVTTFNSNGIIINYNTYTTEKLDNAFYYGVDQMTKSDLFNWTQNTALYTGINAMTTQLEIQTPAIAILLTYWFILTIIYVIIDIVLKGFTLLTHMFSNKV